MVENPHTEGRSAPERLDARQLEKFVNTVAKVQYPRLMKSTDAKIPAWYPNRLHLRDYTDYPYRFTEASELVSINPKESFGRVIEKEREAGLREIHESIGNNSEEHHWLFLPSHNLWIDDTLESRYASPKEDIYLTTYLSYLFPTVQMVHTHPDKLVKRLYELDKIFGSSAQYSEHYLLEGASFSNDDHTEYLQMKSRINPSAKLISSVVSHHGVTSMESNENWKKESGFYNKGNNKYAINPDNDPIEEIKKYLEVYRQNTLVPMNQQGDLTEPAIDLSFLPFKNET